jgi:hypothetical protein
MIRPCWAMLPVTLLVSAMLVPGPVAAEWNKVPL